jgi:hypothetical protein
MSHDLVCWRCGAALAALSLPLRRLDECPACRAELHVCRLCRSYDPRVQRKCREDDAEEVKHKDQANFCDYFRPRPGAFDAALAAAEAAAHSQLAGLFGAGPAPGAAPAGGEPDPDALFGGRDGKGGSGRRGP